MSQYPPTSEFEKLQLREEYILEQIVEVLTHCPDNNEFGYFIECDLEYPVEIKEKKTFLFVRIKQKQILIFSQLI